MRLWRRAGEGRHAVLLLRAVTEAASPEEPRRRSRGAVVTLLGVTQILAWGSSYYLPAVLADPISRDTGWSLAWVVGGLSLGLVAAAIVSPRAGSRIGDGHGRQVLSLSAILLTAGLFTVGLSQTLPVYFAGWILIGVGMGTGLYDAAFAMLGSLYGMGARRAITALTLFGGFASTVCWPLSAFLLGQFGWRGVCIVYACIQLGFSLPLYWFLLPSAPARDLAGRESERQTAAAKRLITREQLPSFVLLTAAIGLAALISTIVSVHLLTILQSQGMALATAVALGAIVGPSQVSARVMEMALGRHYNPIWTKLAAVSFVCAGLFLLALSFPIPAISLILYGCGVGIESIARGALPLALYGSEGYGARLGRIALVSLFAQAAAPFLGALLLEAGGPGRILTVLCALAAANVVLVAALDRLARKLPRLP